MIEILSFLITFIILLGIYMAISVYQEKKDLKYISNMNAEHTNKDTDMIEYNEGLQYPIVLKFKGCFQALSIEEAKKLRDELNKILD